MSSHIFKKAVVISSVPANSSYAGGPLGVFGNLLCLSEFCLEVVNIAICRERYSPNAERFSIVHIELNTESNVIAQLEAKLAELKPEIVWLHHYWIWKYFKPISKQYPFVMQSGDPDWEIISLRYKNSKKPSGKLSYIKNLVRHLIEKRRAFRDEQEVFRDVKRFRGVASNWCPGEELTLSKRVGQSIPICVLGYEDFGMRRIVNKHNLLMLGNVDGANTRSGLLFFFNSLWPFLKSSNRVIPRIRMVGSGNLPSHIKVPEPSEKFEWVGYVADLEKEWENSFALFVPVPEKMGLRTRIIEAWSRGVPVIAHTINEQSVPEMIDKVNYIGFSDSDSFLSAIEVLYDDEKYDQLVREGRNAFLENYSIESVAPAYRNLSILANSLKEK